MRITNALAISLGLMLSIGCHHQPASSEPGSSATGNSGTPSGPEINPEIPAEIKVCQVNCEIVAEMKVIHLNPGEQKSLQNALPNKAAVSAATHVHIDAQDGHLTFNSDQDPAHIGANAGQITVGPATPPVRAVMSPAAAALLQKRGTATTQ
jgi:hypothetical protein